MQRRKKASTEEPGRRREGGTGSSPSKRAFKKGIAIANNIDGSRGIRREALVCVASRP